MKDRLKYVIDSRYFDGTFHNDYGGIRHSYSDSTMTMVGRQSKNCAYGKTIPI